MTAAFLTAAAYWNQYNAHLAVPLAMLCGLGVDRGLRRIPVQKAVPLVALAAAGLVAVPGIVWVVDRRRDVDWDQRARVESLGRTLGHTEEACAFEVQELVMIDRWPPVLHGQRSLVDAYGQMLLDAVRGGARYASATEAFASEAAQHTVRAQLARCPRVVLGWRGRWQLNPTSRALVPETSVVDR